MRTIKIDTLVKGYSSSFGRALTSTATLMFNNSGSGNFVMDKDGFLSNNAGGIVGGISTGADIVFRCAVKPTSSIEAPQKTVDIHGNEVTCETFGRHDPIICPRIVPVVESMTAIVLLDHLKRQAALHTK